MSRLSRLRGNQVLTALQQAGFDIVRVRGSHHFLRHPDGCAAIVPVHLGEDIGPGLLNKILADCELTRDAFEKLL